MALILEALELQRISTGVQKEHSRLLTRFTFEPDIGFDDEVGAVFAQNFGEAVPILPRQHSAEMADRHIFPVHNIGGFIRLVSLSQMETDLMTEKIEINPALSLAALGAAQQFAVETACCLLYTSPSPRD